jgi:ketosteroid isomerase-like protein
MKKAAVLFAVVLMALTLQAQTGGVPHNGGVPQIITQNEQEWAAAEKAGDYAKVTSLLADRLVSMDSDGTLSNKLQFLANGKGTKWQVNEVSGIQVNVYGDTAIATGAWVGKGTRADGQTIDAHEHWVDTWMKMPNGKWQCIASASAPTKM